MKRIVIIAMMLICFADVAKAAVIWDTTRTTVQSYQLIFLGVRNEYQLRYALNGLPAGTSQVRANFWSTTNVYYDATFDDPTGIAYLTCNGTYIFEMLDSSGSTIAETKQIKTTKINNPPCRSYENGQLRDQLNIETDGNGNYWWDSRAGAAGYDIYKDGELIKTNGFSDVGFTATEDGVYTVVAVDGQGNHVASSDFIYGTGGTSGVDGNNGEGNSGNDGGGCDACKWLTDALSCPAWDDVMGDLTDAIKDALPPPPNWDDIADTFVDHFADYFGDVPPPPSKQQIDNNITPPLPTLDVAVPDMTPQVPQEFNDAPLDTDITSGEVIEIIDESEPFEIYDPDAFINSDDVGVMVYPDDPRNSSGGIKAPDRIDTGYEMPTPQPQPTRPISNIPTPQPKPTTEIPTPTSNIGTTPLPTDIGGSMPTPQPREGG